MEVSGQLHAVTASPRGKNPGIQYIASWVGARTGLYAVEKTKSVVLLGNRTQIIQLVAYLYAKYAIYCTFSM
jgi:hypothetical protein